MALPTIVFNSGGSDTLASGAGPGTAVTGTLAATASSTTVTITDAVALGGVAVDGSAVLWVSTASGKQWAKITAISGTSGAWTVTVSDAYGVTASGQSWAIGGKRATLAGSLQLGTDCRSGWTIDVQTDQVLTANFNLKPNQVGNQWTTFTCSQGTRATISTSTNSIYGLDIQNANNLVVSHLYFKSTAGTPGGGIGPAGFAGGANYVTVQDCVVEGFANGIMDHDAGSNVDVLGMVISGCELKNCTTGLFLWSGAQVSDCYVHGGTTGLNASGTRTRATNLLRCIFDSVAGNGAVITAPAQTGVLIEHCVFSNCTAAGTIYGLDFLSGTQAAVVIRNCIFWNNKNYGIGGAVSNLEALYLTNNAFGSHITAPTQSPFTTGLNPITLTVNPFVSSTDFAPNATAGGGALCRGGGATIPNASATAAAPDVGAVAAGSSGASGGGPAPPFIARGDLMFTD